MNEVSANNVLFNTVLPITLVKPYGSLGVQRQLLQTTIT